MSHSIVTEIEKITIYAHRIAWPGCQNIMRWQCPWDDVGYYMT